MCVSYKGTIWLERPAASRKGESRTQFGIRQKEYFISIPTVYLEKTNLWTEQVKV